MKMIQQHQLTPFFQSYILHNVTVIKRSAKEWYFTFEAQDAKTKIRGTYMLWTQRGKQKLWTNPGTLFAFLEKKYAVKQGRFKLQEESQQ